MIIEDLVIITIIKSLDRKNAWPSILKHAQEITWTWCVAYVEAKLLLSTIKPDYKLKDEAQKLSLLKITLFVNNNSIVILKITIYFRVYFREEKKKIVWSKSIGR